MAVCNVFKALTKETGTFLTFSQYMEDLTAWQTESKFHKLVPSKFIAMELNPGTYTNETLPRVLQVRFENACAWFKNHVKDTNIDWAPSHSTTLFWNAMFSSGLLTNDTNDATQIKQINEIKYVGDINLQSYNNVDGVGYSEIYCHIPDNAASYKYGYVKNDLPQDYSIELNSSAFHYLQGLDIELIQSDFDADNTLTYALDKKYTFSWDDQTIKTEKLDDKSFNINAIVVLYDIWNDGTILAQGVPMGIYFTGKIENTAITNAITKYVSNEDIYDSGTSYGLRICSRYVVASENDQYSVKDVTCEDNNYGELSKVLAQLSVSQNKMDSILSKKYIADQNYKNLLSIFANSKTNVPYIRQVDGKDYWFVNGKLQTLASKDIYSFGSNSCAPYSNEELDSYIGYDSLGLHTSLQISNDTNDNSPVYGANTVLLDASSTQNSNQAIIHWQATYQYQNLDWVNEFKLSKLTINDDQSITETVIEDVTTNSYNYDKLRSHRVQLSPSAYVIRVGYKGNTIKSPLLKIDSVYPTYFGHSSTDFLPSNGGTLQPIVQDLAKTLLPTRSQSYIVNNQATGGDLRHMYLIYPKKYGELTSIADEDGRNYMSDFARYEVTLHEQQYYLYMDQKGPVGVTNKIIYFK